MIKKIVILVGVLLSGLAKADIKISALPLNSVPSSIQTADSFPFVSTSGVATTERFRLSDLPTTPAFVSKFSLFAPIDSPTFTGIASGDFAGTFTLTGGGTGFVYATSDVLGVESNAAATALLSAFVGDSGSGGTKGLVPAPSTGDSAAGKFLAAGGSWAVPSGSVSSVGFSVPASSIFTATGSPVTSSGTLGFTVSGVSGGIPYFDTTSTLHTSSILTANQLLVGGGAGSSPAIIGSLGTTTTVLHGNASGGPSFGAVVLTTDVSGKLPYANLADLTSGNIIVGSAGNVPTSVAMSSEASIVASGAVTLANSAVIGKVLTGYSSGSGIVAATDTILQGIQKLNGNDALKQPLATLTTKGDIYVATGSSTVVRLPVGVSDGQVLTVDSAQTSGLKYSTPPSVTPTIFGTRGSPLSIVAATGITSGGSAMSTTAATQDIYVQGSISGDSACATITAGTIDGQRMTIIGRNDAQTLSLTSATTNFDGNGPVTLRANGNISLRWDGTNWSEVNRR